MRGFFGTSINLRHWGSDRKIQ